MKRQSLLGSRSILVLSALLVLIVFSISAFSQQGTSSVRGVITDQQGNVVAGATVTLINPATTASRTTTTGDGGVYAFESVSPGDYRVEVEARGFKKAVITNVHALVSKATPVDARLEIGNVAETVTVVSGVGEALINRDDATLGNNFVNQQITQLPLEARNPLALLTLQAAVTREGYVAGTRSDQSNITLDGVDINDAQTNAIAGVDAIPNGGGQLTASQSHPVIRLNAEAIEEFRVTTVSANANQGRSSGAQISLVTKSGTNSWHGALFEANRTTALTANNFFNNRSGVARPKLIRNTFGGAIGGPIIKNKLFFFYSYEERRDVSETSVTRTVPLASLGRGEVRYLNSAGGITTLTTAQLNSIFLPGMNPAAIAVLASAAAKYPANDFTTGDSSSSRLLNTAGFRFNAPTPVKLHSHTGRFDYNLTSKQVVFLRTNIIYDLTGGVPQFPDTPAPNLWEHPWGFVAGHTWSIGNKYVNNFRFGITREAFSQQGDSGDNNISFRFVYSPRAFTRTLARTTPVKNITDDFSWLSGNHSVTVGTNIRLISNVRSSFASAYDSAITNPSGYFAGGNSMSDAVNQFGTDNLGQPIDASSTDGIQASVTALVGRFSQYTGNFIFGHDGIPLAAGSPANRNFRTNGYDWYGQDVWKMRPNLTLTYGLRYSLSTPIWENNGFETATNIPLSDFFAKRLAGAAAGTPFNDPISINLSGKANGKPPLYNYDKNNFQPRVAVAWSPRFKKGLLGRFFGTHDESVIRGGFGITNDYYGEQLAVSFDLNNALGFSSQQNINVNTYSIPDIYGFGGPRPVAPLFTGFGQAIRPLPGITSPGTLTFPQTAPFTTARPIQSSLDQALVAPIHYSWNATFERQLPHGLVLQASYIGRAARHLIASRDVMAFNNLVEPKSGMDWYTAAGMLEDLRVAGVSISALQTIPYFQNLFPANLAHLLNVNYFGCDDPCLPADQVVSETLNQTQAVFRMGSRSIFGNDWTDTQDALDQAVNGGISTSHNLFIQPQYGALSTFSSIAKSNYNALTLSLRERLGTSLTMDFNYTLSHSLDDASGLATSGAYGGAFILNPIRQRDSYANSDFDVRHIININAVWQLPLGRGRAFFGNANKWVNGVIGGWQLSGIYRWNSGLPVGFYGDSGVFDTSRWATNWNVQSNGIRIKPVNTCPDRGGLLAPKLFGCNTGAAYNSFRNAKPGESGDRNVFRVPGYIDLDVGLGKSFSMPWSEKQKLQVRAEAFNVGNTQRLGQYLTSRSGFGINLKPSTAKPPGVWSNFTAIQGTPRVLQFGFRFEF